MKRKWLPVQGFEHKYEISNDGYIRIHTPTIIHKHLKNSLIHPYQSSKTKTIYYRLNERGVSRTKRVPQLLKEHFPLNKVKINRRWMYRKKKTVGRYNRLIKYWNLRGSNKPPRTGRHDQERGNRSIDKHCPYKNNEIKGTAAYADFKSGCSFLWNFEGVINK